jgi:ubiquinol-cytochrome c reductase iron-sulfur subunit
MSSDATVSTFTPAPLDSSKRTWLIASGCAGCAGVVGLATPLVRSFGPSEQAKAAGGPVEADISSLKPGEKMIVPWRGKPVWILNRTPEMMEDLKKTSKDLLADPDSKRTSFSTTPEYARNDARARADRSNVLVAVGLCTHLGCSPVDKLAAGGHGGMPENWSGGFFCPCHGSRYDLSGRVYKSQPAPDNLQVPPHQYLSETRLLIGDDTRKA